MGEFVWLPEIFSWIKRQTRCSLLAQEALAYGPFGHWWMTGWSFVLAEDLFQTMVHYGLWMELLPVQ